MGARYPLQETCLAVICGMPVVALVFVGLRLYARRRLGSRISWDDWLVVIANILSLALIGPSYRYVKMWHIGIHIWDVNPQHLEPNYDEDYLVILFFNLINTLILPLVKASIIMLLLRIGSVIDWVRKMCYFLMVFNVLACVVPWGMFLFMCPPQTGNTWKPRTFGGLHCVNRHQWGSTLVFVTSANLFTDLLILPIPFLIMRKVRHAGKWARLVVVLLFASSLAVTAIGAVKIHLTYRDRLYTLFKSDWTYTIDYCMNHIENNVAIIVACVPTLRHLVRGWAAHVRTSRTVVEDEYNSWSASERSQWTIMRPGSKDRVIADPDQINVTVTTNVEVTMVDKSRNSSSFPFDEKAMDVEVQAVVPCVLRDEGGLLQGEELLLHDEGNLLRN